MGRKSLIKERTSQILDAFERCIVKYGLEESSIPRIAEEAGVKHSIIRHYIGNRNALVSAMVIRFTSHYKELIFNALNMPDLMENTSTVFTYFFDEFTRNNAECIIFSQLFSAATKDESIRRNLLAFYQEIEAHTIRIFSSLHPDIPRDKIETVTYAILSLWLGHTQFFHLGFGQERIGDATTAAEVLTERLRRP